MTPQIVCHADMLMILSRRGDVQKSRYTMCSLTFPFYLKADHKISHKKGAMSVPGRERCAYHQRLAADAEMDLYEQT